MRKQLTRPLLAAVRDLLGRFLLLLPTLGRGQVVVCIQEERVQSGGVGAFDGSGGVDPSRVESDHVVLIQDFGLEAFRKRCCLFYARAAGAAGIDEQAPDRLAALGGNLEHGNRDRLALGLFVIERNLRLRALQAGTIFAFAFRPRQLLPVELLQPFRGIAFTGTLRSVV